MHIDIFIVPVYFAFLMGVGWMFRRPSSSTSDYFRGGEGVRKMLWWMIGSTAFMTALSVMTFFSVMGKALTSGVVVPPDSIVG